MKEMTILDYIKEKKYQAWIQAVRDSLKVMVKK